MIRNKIIVTASLLLASLSYCFAMELPKGQPLIIGTEHAALFATLAKDAQEVLLADENNLEINDIDDEIVLTSRRSSECPICKKIVARLKEHLFIHTGEKPFKCDQCDFSCIRSHDLRRHLYTHSGLRPFKCLECDYSCTGNSYLKLHMRIHTGEKPFKCDQCDYSCSIKNNLMRHMSKHTGEKPFKCDQCDFCSAWRTALAHHKKRKPV